MQRWPAALRAPPAETPVLPLLADSRRRYKRSMAGPLAHLTVLDLTDLRGALAGRLLADLGADVIKIEPPGGDADRWRPPFAGNVAAPDRSLPFLYRNANKRGTGIDLHDREGAARFAALCSRADVLLENYGANRRQVLDLAPEAVRERHPQLVHVIISDFGLSGPRAHWRAEPLVAFAASGALYASGLPDRPPCWLPGFAAHDCAAARRATSDSGGGSRRAESATG